MMKDLENNTEISTNEPIQDDAEVLSITPTVPQAEASNAPLDQTAEVLAEESLPADTAEPEPDDEIEDLFEAPAGSEPPPAAEQASGEEEASRESATQKKLPLFNRKGHSNLFETEEELASMELVCEKSGLSQDDVHMLFELGYENELGRLVGYENLKQLKSDLQKVESQHETHRYLTAFGYRGTNFVSNTARASIVAAYVRDRRFEIVRLLVCALCTVLLFFIDQPFLLEGTVFESLAPENARLWDAFSLALVIPPILLSFRHLYAGLRSFFAFSPTPYSFPAILTPLALLYSSVVIVLQGDMLRINFLFSCVLLLTAVCDLLRLCSELRIFRLLSTSDEKFVLTEATPSKKKLRHNGKIVKILNDDLGKNIYEMHKTQQTIGFFRRCNTMSTAHRPFAILTVGMLSLSILYAFVATIYTDNLASALSLAMTTLMVSMPVTFFLAFLYPLSRANRILARKHCALIGEESVEELSGEKTVVLRDTLMYNAEKTAEIAIRENSNFHRDLHLAGALFRKLGGTLKKLGVTRTSPRAEPQITILRVHEYGVEAVADNRIKIHAGSADFLRHNGIRVPREKNVRAGARPTNVSLMYVAIDGVLKLSYEIEYTLHPSFEKLVSDLADGDVVVAIASYDPNLNETFLEQNRNDEIEHVTVRKPGRFEEDKPVDKADTAVVALHQATDLAYPLYAAKSISTVRHFGWRMQLIASILGALAVLLLMIFNPNAPLSITSILAYQALWVTVFTLSAHAELSESRFRFRK